MRHHMMRTLHSSHLGIVKSKSRARESLYWPGMVSQIEEEISRCSICALNSKQNPKESMIVTDTPGRPWSIVSTDLFEYRGGHYLITIDHYSKWPEIARLENLSSANTITNLKSQFSKYGIPDILQSDNGPQFSSREFAEFVRDYGYVHKTTSPHYAQANGQVERTVQTVK
jgi:transposase InsO family protein